MATHTGHAAQQHAAAGLACEASGYCSLGKVKPFVGDVHPSDGLQAALDARSYKKELIITVFLGNSIPQALQWHNQLEKLGIAHVLDLANSPEHCQRLLTFRPDLGCAYLTSIMTPHTLTHNNLLWHWRYRVLARVLQKGYNAMSSDFDVLWFDDPYKYFKQPPLNRVQMLGQCELEAWETCNYLNGGFVYVQNARPSGPAIFAIGNTADLQLRWTDDDMEWLVKVYDHKPRHTMCMSMDQLVLNEGMPWVLWGRPVFSQSRSYCTPKDIVKSIEHKARFGRVWDDKVVGAYRATKKPSTIEVDPRSDIAARYGSTTISLPTYTIRLPNANGQWPDEFGGRFLPPTRGNVSKAFLAELAADCPECPRWPDYEDPVHGPVYNKTTEEFAFMPDWMFMNWLNRGQRGYWNTRPAMQVLGHIHYLPSVDAVVGKHFVALHQGFFNWTLAVWLAQHSTRLQDDLAWVYLNKHISPTGLTIMQPQQQPAAARRAPDEGSATRVLALAPSFPLHALSSEAELRWLMVALLQLATLSHRTVVWPSIPCMQLQFPWTKPRDTLKLPLPVVANRYLVYGGDTRTDQGAVRCAYLMLAFEACHSVANALLEMEFRHWRSQAGLPEQPLEEQLLPMPPNANLPAPSRSIDDDAKSQGGSGLLPLMREVDARVAKDMLQERAAQQVLYLEHPLLVWYSADPEGEQLQAQLLHRSGKCPVTMTDEGGRKLKKFFREEYVDPLPKLELLLGNDGASPATTSSGSATALSGLRRRLRNKVITH